MTDYRAENPFDESAPPSLPPKPTNTTMRPVSSQPFSDPALASRAERLRSMEEDLNRRENDLDNRSKILLDREKNGQGPRAPNWPRCRPIVYQNIEGDIPDPTLKRYVRFAYIAWMVFAVMLLYNVAELLAVLAVDSSGKAIGDFILSIVFFFLLTPIAFLIYRQLYKAARKERVASRYVMFLCSYFFQILTHIFFALGIQGTGAGGFIAMFALFSDDKTAVGFMLLAASIVWTVLAIFSVYLWIAIRVEYKRRTNGSEDLKKEASKTAVEGAQNHPELFEEGVKQGYRFAENNPELVAKGVKSTF